MSRQDNAEPRTGRLASIKPGAVVLFALNVSAALIIHVTVQARHLHHPDRSLPGWFAAQLGIVTFTAVVLQSIEASGGRVNRWLLAVAAGFPLLILAQLNAPRAAYRWGLKEHLPRLDAAVAALPAGPTRQPFNVGELRVVSCRKEAERFDAVLADGPTLTAIKSEPTAYYETDETVMRSPAGWEWTIGASDSSGQ